MCQLLRSPDVLFTIITRFEFSELQNFKCTVILKHSSTVNKHVQVVKKTKNTLKRILSVVWDKKNSTKNRGTPVYAYFFDNRDFQGVL